MLLDIDNKEMARVMLEQVAERLIAWKRSVERLDDRADREDVSNAHEAIVAYEAVRQAATSMRLVPGVRALERRANEIADADKDGWDKFFTDAAKCEEVLKAGLDAMEITGE